MARRRAQDHIGTCHLCLQQAPLSFEHVPPQAAFNDRRVEIGSLEHWLTRDAEGPRLRRTIQQGGSGFHRFCGHCNNRTGSWYASELTGWVRGAVAAVAQLPPIADMDEKLEPHAAQLQIEGVRPLAFVKQIATMVLAINGVAFAERHPALREFVLDRDRVGVPEDIQLYLALYLGPSTRLSGVQGTTDTATGEIHLMSEIDHPPFAYVASFDEPSPLPEIGNITGFGDVSYTTRATAEIDLLVGFGHTIYPVDFRTAAQLARDREENAAEDG
ncbi:MAG: hypothetical protein ACRDPC_26495 [Solirubrobacteraceae bacterium]